MCAPVFAQEAGGPALAVPVHAQAGAPPGAAPEPAAPAQPAEGEKPSDFQHWLYGDDANKQPGAPVADPGSDPVRAAPDAPARRGLLWVGLDLAMWLGVVLLLAVGGIWLMKKLLPGGRKLWKSGPMTVLGRLTLTPKHGVYLFKVGRRLLVVGMGQEGMRTLAVIDDPDEVAAVVAEAGGEPSRAPVTSFKDALARVGIGAAPSPEESGPDAHEELEATRKEVENLQEILADMRKRSRKSG